jgi:two-component system KDP operon response regulator KdpE
MMDDRYMVISRAGLGAETIDIDLDGSYKESRNSAAGTVLLVTEDRSQASALRQALLLDGHTVQTVIDPDESVRRVTDDLPDLVVLDDRACQTAAGFDVLAAIRYCSLVPVIVVSDDDDETAKVSALDRGADDYLVRPFGERELRSRVRAVLRRTNMPAPTPKTQVVVDDYLTIDFGRREVIVGGRHVPLRPTEYRLLYHLVNNAGRVLTHETLLAKVWGYEYRTEEHYVRLYVTYLRQKIEPDPRRPQYILNERGLGYRFRDLPTGTRAPALVAISN